LQVDGSGGFPFIGGWAMAAERKALANKGPGVGKRIINFFSESWLELKKVSWPSWPEVKNFTWVVIATIIFVGLMLFVFDSFLSMFTRKLF
jgi:preprotein translocase subunit SecE